MVVGPVARLLDEGGRETVGEGPVVGKLRVDEVVDLKSDRSVKGQRRKATKETYVPCVLEGGGPAEDVVLDALEEGLSLLGLLLEVVRSVEVLDVLGESRAVSPALKGPVIARLDGLNYPEIEFCRSTTEDKGR